MILVEVLRRTSNNYGVVQRVGRLTRHLERQGRVQSPTPRPEFQRHKLSQRLSDVTVAGILAAYQAGATTREVGERFGLAHSSVNKLLKRHGVMVRKRGPSPTGGQLLKGLTPERPLADGSALPRPLPGQEG